MGALLSLQSPAIPMMTPPAASQGPRKHRHGHVAANAHRATDKGSPATLAPLQTNQFQSTLLNVYSFHAGISLQPDPGPAQPAPKPIRRASTPLRAVAASGRFGTAAGRQAGAEPRRHGGLISGCLRESCRTCTKHLGRPESGQGLRRQGSSRAEAAPIPRKIRPNAPPPQKKKGQQYDSHLEN